MEATEDLAGARIREGSQKPARALWTYRCRLTGRNDAIDVDAFSVGEASTLAAEHWGVGRDEVAVDGQRRRWMRWISVSALGDRSPPRDGPGLVVPRSSRPWFWRPGRPPGWCTWRFRKAANARKGTDRHSDASAAARSASPAPGGRKRQRSSPAWAKTPKGAWFAAGTNRRDPFRGRMEAANRARARRAPPSQARDKGERPGRNPNTGGTFPIAARRVVTFRSGQKLKAGMEAYAEPRSEA